MHIKKCLLASLILAPAWMGAQPIASLDENKEVLKVALLPTHYNDVAPNRDASYTSYLSDASYGYNTYNSRYHLDSLLLLIFLITIIFFSTLGSRDRIGQLNKLKKIIVLFTKMMIIFNDIRKVSKKKSNHYHHFYSPYGIQ